MKSRRQRQAKISRRSFLKTSAATAALLPFGSSLKAAPSVAPLRLIQIWTPFHIPEQIYHPPTANGTGVGTGTNFTLNYTNSILAPLASYQSQMIIFRGLNFADPAAKAQSGHTSFGTMFSGASCTYGQDVVTKITGTTLDQYLYSRMAQAGSLQPMVVGVMPYLFGQDDPLSYINGVGIHAEGNPQNTYKAYFANYKAAGSAPDPQIAATYNRRKAALTFAQKGLTTLMGRLTGPQQQKLTQHAGALTGLQSQLDAGQTTPTVACTPPTSASIPADTGSANGNIDWSKMNADFGAFSTLITQAFACDITRFATLRMTFDIGDDPTMLHQIAGLETYNKGDWHAYTHATSGEKSNSIDVLMSYYQKYFMTQVKALLDKLAATPDPYNPAAKLLDNTVVLLTNEHGLQTPGIQCHSYTDAPFVLLGGCGGYFKMGRIFETTPRMAGTEAYAGVPHNALLAAIANAFEMNQAAYNPAYVPNILTQYGAYAAAPLVLG